MKPYRFKPKFDRLFYIPIGITVALMIFSTVICTLDPVGLWIIIAADLFVLYFICTSFAGYVELRESVVFVKFGFFLKREIPYNKIRKIDRQHKIYSESMLALKNSLDHINIRYNLYDIVSVSVVDNDELIGELCRRAGLYASADGVYTVAKNEEENK